jgi:hypothetical protein
MEAVYFSTGGWFMYEVIVIALLLIITGLLLHINIKLPARDRVREALDRDLAQRDSHDHNHNSNHNKN